MKKVHILLYVLCMILAPHSAQADILELDPQTFLYVNEIPAAWEYIDFSEYNDVDLLTNGPINVGGASGELVTFTANSTNPPPINPPTALLGNGIVDLGVNGMWDSNREGYVASPNAPGSSVDFVFDRPIKGIGALFSAYQLDQEIGIQFYIGYREGSGVLQTTPFAILGQIVDPDLEPASKNTGLQIGLYTTNPQGLNFITLTTGSQLVVDDVRFTRTAVPEPASLLLFGIGMTGAALTRRRER
ncbi:MAG: PEP-CTERM sorting domain-containing protein [Candidatus Omnitrophica bacterium]|nr:PEP-CTERM sorting domain-containing protein [Candidatus Omnitrophota bacterium]MCB9722286.1 PEP-CTERM sorting domain-containing protein [Candidatus Omnitrophota bacterium]